MGILFTVCVYFENLLICCNFVIQQKWFCLMIHTSRAELYKYVLFFWVWAIVRTASLSTQTFLVKTLASLTSTDKLLSQEQVCLLGSTILNYGT
jgi:hypothetical protein